MASGANEAEQSATTLPQKAKKSMLNRVWEKIVDNVATSVAVAVIGLVGICATLLWATITRQLSAELDERIAARIADKASLTHKALLSTFAEETANTDAQEVGALSIGTVVLTRDQSEQTVHLYMPANYRSQIWLGIQYTNMIAPDPAKPSILRVALNGRRGPEIPNVYEHGFDLSAAISKAQAISREDVISTSTNSIVSLPPLSRLADLHTITFVADPSAFTAAGQSIFIKYVAVVQPAIRLNKELR